MAREHCKLGCLCCGKRRRTEDIINKTYDVYLKDKVSGSLMRVGLCKDCFKKKNDHCLDMMKNKLESSEKNAAKVKGRQKNSKVFKNARFVGRMSYKDFWKAADKKKPEKAAEYLEIVKNERN